MSPLCGSVLVAALFASGLLSACSKAEEAPEERDPNATTMRMVGRDGEEVTADIVETDKGMKMRVRDADGKESSIEMEMPEGIRGPSFGTGRSGGREDSFSDFDRRFDERSEQFRKRFDERADEFDRRFKERQEAFDRRFEQDRRRMDEQIRPLDRAGPSSTASERSPFTSVDDNAAGDSNLPVDEDR
jgi:hypothetical protein